ncbi:MAG TPA: shikimate dehydrogenase, partial [Paenirhodobacter sp.]
MPNPLRIDGETRFYPIIGHPIGQVKSPTSLSQIMADRDFNGMVMPLDIRPEDLPAWLSAAKKVVNCDGIVITVPLKVSCMAFCERVSARAQAAGAVNIMIRDGDDWVGDATDGHGHMDGVVAQGFDVTGKPALLIGAGGAGAAIAYEILARGASELAVH